MIQLTGLRPAGITALSVFFAVGAVISFTSSASLFFPGSFLEPMWRLNPRALEAFHSMGGWAIVMLCTVCAGCAFAAVGLWRGVRWGYRLAVGILVINLTGDIANVVLGTEPRAAIGIPIVLLILAFLLTRRVKSFFNRPIVKIE
ncbi:MAG: hypothetical protein IPL01_21915 [Acidobacteria bacterium]|nr:hypothetical protein [Acidobacteriota bacterium]